MSDPLSVLIVEDNPVDCDLVVQGLKRAGIDARWRRVDTEEWYVEQLRAKPDIILADYSLPLFGALRALELLAESGLDIPCIVLTGSVDEGVMVECMKCGAADYLLKDRMTRLGPAVKRALNERDLRAQKRRADLDAMRDRALKEAAEARADLSVELERSNRELQQSNSRLKAAQAQLIQTEKMASLGQLVAGIAHEINNPLAFIVNNLFTIEAGLDRISPEAEPHLSKESREKLRKLRARVRETGEGLDRVKELVLNLRTFSRLDEGEFKAVDIGDSIDSVLAVLKHKTNGRIKVEKHYGPERSLTCHAGRLNQVFMNLIANAADAITGKGTITITTNQTETTFIISVRDTGKGIPKAIQDRIFEPFFTTKPVGKGTGLGLAISYGIVLDHQGSIEVESQEGLGTEFSIRIPRDLESRRGNAERKAVGVG